MKQPWRLRIFIRRQGTYRLRQSTDRITLPSSIRGGSPRMSWSSGGTDRTLRFPDTEYHIWLDKVSQAMHPDRGRNRVACKVCFVPLGQREQKAMFREITTFQCYPPDNSSVAHLDNRWHRQYQNPVKSCMMTVTDQE